MTKPALTPKLVETEAEREAVRRLRYEVLVEEFGYAHTCARDGQLVEPEDEGAELMVIETEGRIVAVIRVCRGEVVRFPPRWDEVYGLARLEDTISRERVSVTGRLVIHREYRTTGVIRTLLAAAYHDACSHGVWIDYTDCCPGMISLYEQLGYRRYTSAFVDPDAGNRVPMLMLVEDTRHLELVRSPLLYLNPIGAETSSPNLVDLSRHAAQAAQLWFHETFPEHARYVNRQALPGPSFWLMLAHRLSEAPGEAIPLFRELADEDICRVLDRVGVMSFEPDQFVVRAGERGEEMFIILSGLAEVFLHADGERHSVSLLGRGDVFGEVGLIGEDARTADVVARGQLELLVISGHALRRLVDREPHIASTLLYNLSIVLCHRVRTMSRIWAESLTPPTDAS